MAGSLRDLVPDDRILARVDRVLRLSWLRAEVSDCYAAPGIGRPGIGPKAALRLMLAGFLLDVLDDRRLLRQAQVDLAIRWFVRRDDAARRLATIPGVGPITASLMRRRRKPLVSPPSPTSACSRARGTSLPGWAWCRGSVRREEKLGLVESP